MMVGTTWDMTEVVNTTDYYRKTFSSWDRYVFINFSSDTNINKTGFQIEYNAGTQKMSYK